MTTRTPRERRFSIGRSIAIGVALLLLCVNLVDGYVFAGGSMQPAMHSGERFLVSRLAYGLSFLLSDARVIAWGTPVPGEIIVHWAGPSEVVKRVIGVAGDRVVVQSQRVSVNGRVITGAFAACEDPRFAGQLCAREALGGRTWQVMAQEIEGVYADSPAVTVPAGHLFVLGDHRDESNDSRNPVIGMVPLEDVVGPVSLVWMNAQSELVFETP